MTPQAQVLKRWWREPITFVRGELGIEPDAWQAEALRVFPTVNRLAMKACKGPGKTALIAWLILNFLATRPYCRIGAVSITGDNLDQNLWPELAFWMDRSPFMRETFTWTKSSIFHKLYPANWWCQARAFSKTADPQQQAHALAGLHADYAMAVLDESGGIPQAVMVTAEAVLSTGVETKVVQAGNPTHLDGPLYRACSVDRGLWHVIEITGDPDDAARSPRIDLDWARQQIQMYGRENPWVMVNVLGKFPPSSINALLGPDEVHAAMQRHLRPDQYAWAQKRIGVDVARAGGDRTVLFPRQGLASFQPTVLRFGHEASVSVDIAQAVMAGKARWGSEVELFDATGGWAAGAVDVMRSQGHGPINVQFAAPAIDVRYANRRAEIWWAMAAWIQSGGALPPLPEMVAELTTPTYTFQKGKFLLEEKDAVKKRIGHSPDLADALALTFGLVEMPAAMQQTLRRQQTNTAVIDFDPYREEARV